MGPASSDRLNRRPGRASKRAMTDDKAINIGAGARVTISIGASAELTISTGASSTVTVPRPPFASDRDIGALGEFMSRTFPELTAGETVVSAAKRLLQRAKDDEAEMRSLLTNWYCYDKPGPLPAVLRSILADIDKGGTRWMKERPNVGSGSRWLTVAQMIDDLADGDIGTERLIDAARDAAGSIIGQVPTLAGLAGAIEQCKTALLDAKRRYEADLARVVRERDTIAANKQVLEGKIKATVAALGDSPPDLPAAIARLVSERDQFKADLARVTRSRSDEYQMDLILEAAAQLGPPRPTLETLAAFLRGVAQREAAMFEAANEREAKIADLQKLVADAQAEATGLRGHADFLDKALEQARTERDAALADLARSVAEDETLRASQREADRQRIAELEAELSTKGALYSDRLGELVRLQREVVDERARAEYFRGRLVELESERRQVEEERAAAVAEETREPEVDAFAGPRSLAGVHPAALEAAEAKAVADEDARA